MRLPIAIVLCFLCGCASATRLSMPESERHFESSVAHHLTQREAFNRTEACLARLYSDLPRVLMLRQTESGTLILKPLVEYRVAYVPTYCRYTLSIAVREGAVALSFELGQNENGTFPPATEIGHIREQFAAITRAVEQCLSAP